MFIFCVHTCILLYSRLIHLSYLKPFLCHLGIVWNTIMSFTLWSTLLTEMRHSQVCSLNVYWFTWLAGVLSRLQMCWNRWCRTCGSEQLVTGPIWRLPTALRGIPCVTHGMFRNKIVNNLEDSIEANMTDQILQ